MNRAERRRRDKASRKGIGGGSKRPKDDPLTLAQQQHQAGNLRAAVDLYRQVLRQNPNHAAALGSLGLAVHQLGDAQQAVKLLSRSLEIDPKSAIEYGNLGEVYRSLGRYAEANESYRRATELMPGEATFHNNLGTSFRELQQPHKAVPSLRRAIELRPDYLRAYYNLADSYMDMNRTAEAAAALREAIDARPDVAESYTRLGVVLNAAGDAPGAIRMHEKAIAMNPGLARAHCNLGIAHFEQGDMDAAERCQHLALKADPGYVQAHYELVRSKRFVDRDGHLAEMTRLFETARLNPRNRSLLAFALGKAHEDIGNDDQAFTWYREANRLRRSLFHFSIGVEARRFEIIHETFTPELFERFSKQGIRDPRPILIVGMPRSGTTLVEQILAAHPAVCGGGELNTLNEIVWSLQVESDGDYPGCLRGTAPSGIDTMAQRYLDALRGIDAEASCVTDKMPANFLHLGLVRLMLPNARIVHCRRDAMDTCFSIFKTQFSAEDLNFAYDLTELGQYYRLYEALMDHWHAVMPGAIVDVDYETLTGNHETETRRLIDACGLPWDDACLSFHELDRQVATASAAQVRQPIYRSSVGKWRRYEEQLEPLRRILEG